jgi:hypothetical protein
LGRSYIAKGLQLVCLQPAALMAPLAAGELRVP